MAFLGRVDGSTASQLDAACEAGLEPFNAALNGWRAAQAGGGDVEMPEWLPQLRCLVQAGVPRVSCLEHTSDSTSYFRASLAPHHAWACLSSALELTTVRCDPCRLCHVS
jgi:hypothetical protein